MRISELKFSLLGPETRKESDASARAMHQQAAQRKARYATTERNNMFKSLKRRVALGAVAAVGAAGLVTIAAPAANAAAISAFTFTAYPQRAVSGSTAAEASQITADVYLTGAETGTLRGVFTSAPTPASIDSSTSTLGTRNIGIGDTITAYVTPYNTGDNGPVVFTAGKSTGELSDAAATANARRFNTAGAYGVRFWFDRNNDSALDADEAYLNTTINIGGVPATISLASSALTVAGPTAKTFSVLLKDAAGNATLLSRGTATNADTSTERVTVLASVATTFADTMTVRPQNIDSYTGTAATATANAGTSQARTRYVSGINGTYQLSTNIFATDSTTASTGAYLITAALSAAGTGTLTFNLGGTGLSPTTPAVGTLTASTVSKATSIALTNTSGVTAANDTAKPSATSSTIAHTGLKLSAPEAMDSGTADVYEVLANPISAKTLAFALTGTAGAIVNVTVGSSSSTDNGVLAATTAYTLDTAGKATFTISPTTAIGTVTVKTNMIAADGTTQATGYSVTWTASSVTAGATGTNGIAVDPDISTVTNIISKVGATNTVKFTVKDQYGVAQQYYAVTPSLSSTSRNYGVTLDPVLTDASGVATVTLKDASTSTTVLSDVLSFAVTAPGVGTNLISSLNKVTITYSTSGTYDSLTLTGGTSTTAEVKRSVLMADNADTTNYSISLAPTLKSAAGATVSGVAITYTGSAGVYFRAAAATPTVGGDKGTLTASSTTTVYAYGTKPGTATVTATGGGLTATATFTVKAITVVDTARSIALVAAGNKFTATVTDGWGNPVPGVTVSFATTSQGIFGGGVTSTSAVTDALGTATAVVQSADGKAGDVTVVASIASTNSQGYAGNLLTNIADVPVTGFVAAVGSASAKGAVTAAATATATTDAATTSKINDIATAVANLSTTVAGLVASLVAQIKDTKAAIADTKAALDKLAAVVAKIQKKVKA